MGQIRKINDVYYIEFYARGLLYSQPAGPSLEEAQKLLAQVEEKIAGGEALTITRHIDLPDFFERFITEAKKQYAPRTVLRFEALVTHFSGFLDQDCPQVHQLAQIFPVVLESYKVHLARTQKAKMVNFTILLLKDVFTFGIKLGFINDNPCTHVRLLPWPCVPSVRKTGRYLLAQRLLEQGVGLGKLTQLLELEDIGKAVYYAHTVTIRAFFS